MLKESKTYVIEDVPARAIKIARRFCGENGSRPFHCIYIRNDEGKVAILAGSRKSAIRIVLSEQASLYLPPTGVYNLENVGTRKVIVSVVEDKVAFKYPVFDTGQAFSVLFSDQSKVVEKGIVKAVPERDGGMSALFSCISVLASKEYINKLVLNITPNVAPMRFPMMEVLEKLYNIEKTCSVNTDHVLLQGGVTYAVVGRLHFEKAKSRMAHMEFCVIAIVNGDNVILKDGGKQ